MEIVWYGQSCIKLKGKNATVIIDPFDPEMTGLKLPKELSSDMVLVTHNHPDHNFKDGVAGIDGKLPMVFSEAGVYEIAGAVVTGVASFHDDTSGSERGVNTIFQLMIDRLNIVHLGDIGQSKLTEEQIAQIGDVDIVFIPVGSNYTIGAKAAANIISQLEPKITIPIHYKIEGLKFELEGVEGFLKEMGAEGVLPAPKLSITKEKLPEEPQVIVLSKI